MLPATSEVDAIWPCTSAAGGESTALLLTSGEVAVFENCSSWSLATVYAQRAGRDLRTLRTLTGELFGDTKACVLPITLSLVLVALKYRRPGYGVVNLSAGRRWEQTQLTAYVNNATGKRYDTFGFPNSATTIYSPPREFGLRLSWHL